ncbi:hypothetical protein HZH66_014317 [Vespula vulgaris]|uniref:Uncharacterized protein n=1 Tax=Vespula vulgaris TaxID=7454 RepID=A0A834J8F5_VESVU|nr:hypothetical protein HZH66_014317 [Vespula vulgaris]
MIFAQSRSRTFEKRCKNFTNKKDKKYLFSQELSVMMKASGRNLRSGKTSTNRTSNKINKSTIKSDTAMTNKKTALKTLRSTSKKSDLIKIEMIKGKEEKEIVSRSKRKSTTETRSTKRIVLSSKKKANIPEGVKLKNKTSSFRQMSLKESFSNQEALSKRLRPRKECRNYCEDSVLQQTNIVSQQQKDTELKNEPAVSDKLKLPVYKSVKLNEESLRNMSDIYDFKFDENDSKEKLTGKRKRRIVNRVGQKRVKKTKRPRQKKVARVVIERLSSDIISLCTKKKIEDNNEQKHVLLPSTDIVEKSEGDIEDQNELLPTADNNKFEAESNNVQNLEANQSLSTQAEDTKKHPEITVSKPTVIPIENLNNNEILLLDTPLKSKPDNFAPFRKTNIFCNRIKSHQENTINDSLISKSLSPIKKTSVNFDVGSPWRLSSLNTFSQVKNLFQSTPQPRTLEILQGKIKQSTKDQATKCLETIKKNEVSEIINEDVNRQKTCEKFNYVNRKVGQAIRKFGTEITNLDNSVSINNNTVITEQYEEMANNKELRVSNKDLQNTTGIQGLQNTTSMDSSTFNDTTEDKENAAPKSPSKSKKFLRNRLRKVTDTNSSPLRKKRHIKDKENSNIQSLLVSTQTFNRSGSLPHGQEEKQEQSTEIFEPQPGPSGLQKFKSPSQKPLQQTNLNAFLNITEMPQSTRINTAHGIFGDAQSTPISGKPIKSIKTINDTKHMGLDNAFGFNEDIGDTILDISPIYSDLTKIKKDTVPKEVKVGENNEKGKAEEPLPETKNKLIDTAAFSDTFDVLGEVKEVKNDSVDISLFTDLEPTHFTQPPTRSYKRKRKVRFNFNESDSEEDEENNIHATEKKRKKHGKLKEHEVRRMEEWVKSINETFQEIDHHELVVE